MVGLTLITPDWPAPKNVRAVATTRIGGVSTGAYSSLNLGSHVGDAVSAVAENRLRVQHALGLGKAPAWLDQVHGTTVVEARAYTEPPTADASFTRVSGSACVVLTADCLPVLFCEQNGEAVAAAHAGWRGLVGGVLAETVRKLDVPSPRLLAWLGPAIEASAFEVGEEVRAAFSGRDSGFIPAFEQNSAGRWQADIYALARHELALLGIARTYGGGFACYADQERFFSYRRDKQTGRMATMIWIAQ